MESEKAQQHLKMMAEPQKEHKWLHKLVGDWTYEGEATMEPGKPPAKLKGVESVRSLGGLWIVAEGKGVCPVTRTEVTTFMTLGFDPEKKRYVGTWIGSTMTHLWIYDGGLDASGKELTLNQEGPDMAVPGKMARYKDVIEFESDDHRVMTSHMLGEDGKWRKLMTLSYRRKN